MLFVAVLQKLAPYFFAIDMATFGEYTPSVVTRDSPCWISGTAPMI